MKTWLKKPFNFLYYTLAKQIKEAINVEAGVTDADVTHFFED